MLLALLMLVVGRLGGPLAALWFETERAIGGGAASPSAPAVTVGTADAVPARMGPGGGADDRPIAPPDGGVEGMGGGGVELADRGGPALGGGGVGFFASAFSAPAFLLIHRLSSGSYTKLLCSPSFALIGLFAGSRLSFLPPPPNQPVRLQDFLADFSAACFAVDC